MAADAILRNDMRWSLSSRARATTSGLARLGYLPTGIDISQEFIDLARRRIREDLYLARDVELGRPGSNPEEIFFQHNIEKEPLNDQFLETFHVAILESCLHHFVDPIAALRHISMALRDDGLVLILEGENRNGPIRDPLSIRNAIHQHP